MRKLLFFLLMAFLLLTVPVLSAQAASSGVIGPTPVSFSPEVCQPLSLVANSAEHKASYLEFSEFGLAFTRMLYREKPSEAEPGSSAADEMARSLRLSEIAQERNQAAYEAYLQMAEKSRRALAAADRPAPEHIHLNIMLANHRNVSSNQVCRKLERVAKRTGRRAVTMAVNGSRNRDRAIDLLEQAEELSPTSAEFRETVRKSGIQFQAMSKNWVGSAAFERVSSDFAGESRRRGYQIS